MEHRRMPYRVVVLKKAAKELAALPFRDRKKIAAAIDALSTDPCPPGVKPMKGEWAGHYRKRVGDYRIIYQVEHDRLVILVVRVGNRRGVYR